MKYCAATIFTKALVFSLSKLAAAALSPDQVQSKIYIKCKSICKEFLENTLDRKMCASALNIMPRPGVYNACVNGRVFGFEAACFPTCIGEGEKATKRADSFEACKREARKARPNQELSWCRSGYEAAFHEVKDAIGEVLRSHHGITEKEESNSDNSGKNGIHLLPLPGFHNKDSEETFVLKPLSKADEKSAKLKKMNRQDSVSPSMRNNENASASTTSSKKENILSGTDLETKEDQKGESLKKKKTHQRRHKELRHKQTEKNSKAANHVLSSEYNVENPSTSKKNVSLQNNAREF